MKHLLSDSIAYYTPERRGKVYVRLSVKYSYKTQIGFYEITEGRVMEPPEAAPIRVVIDLYSAETPEATLVRKALAHLDAIAANRGLVDAKK